MDAILTTLGLKKKKKPQSSSGTTSTSLPDDITPSAASKPLTFFDPSLGTLHSDAACAVYSAGDVLILKGVCVDNVDPAPGGPLLGKVLHVDFSLSSSARRDFSRIHTTKKKVTVSSSDEGTLVDATNVSEVGPLQQLLVYRASAAAAASSQSDRDDVDDDAVVPKRPSSSASTHVRLKGKVLKWNSTYVLPLPKPIIVPMDEKKTKKKKSPDDTDDDDVSPPTKSSEAPPPPVAAAAAKKKKKPKKQRMMMMMQQILLKVEVSVRTSGGLFSSLSSGNRSYSFAHTVRMTNPKNTPPTSFPIYLSRNLGCTSKDEDKRDVSLLSSSGSLPRIHLLYYISTRLGRRKLWRRLRVADWAVILSFCGMKTKSHFWSHLSKEFTVRMRRLGSCVYSVNELKKIIKRIANVRSSKSSSSFRFFPIEAVLAVAKKKGKSKFREDFKRAVLVHFARFCPALDRGTFLKELATLIEFFPSEEEEEEGEEAKTSSSSKHTEAWFNARLYARMVRRFHTKKKRLFSTSQHIAYPKCVVRLLPRLSPKDYPAYLNKDLTQVIQKVLEAGEIGEDVPRPLFSLGEEDEGEVADDDARIGALAFPPTAGPLSWIHRICDGYLGCIEFFAKTSGKSDEKTCEAMMKFFEEYCKLNMPLNRPGAKTAFSLLLKSPSQAIVTQTLRFLTTHPQANTPSFFLICSLTLENRNVDERLKLRVLRFCLSKFKLLSANDTRMELLRTVVKYLRSVKAYGKEKKQAIALVSSLGELRPEKGTREERLLRSLVAALYQLFETEEDLEIVQLTHQALASVSSHVDTETMLWKMCQDKFRLKELQFRVEELEKGIKERSGEDEQRVGMQLKQMQRQLLSFKDTLSKEVQSSVASLREEMLSTIRKEFQRHAEGQKGAIQRGLTAVKQRLEKHVAQQLSPEGTGVGKRLQVAERKIQALTGAVKKNRELVGLARKKKGRGN